MERRGAGARVGGGRAAGTEPGGEFRPAGGAGLCRRAADPCAQLLTDGADAFPRATAQAPAAGPAMGRRRADRDPGAGAGDFDEPEASSEESRVGQSVSARVDLGGRRILKKKTKPKEHLAN